MVLDVGLDWTFLVDEKQVSRGGRDIVPTL